MKKLLFVLLFFAFSPLSNSQISINCLPDKGIKVAKTIAEKESEVDKTNGNLNNYREVHYDIAGRVISIKNGLDGSIFRRVYKDGKLQLMISIRKKLPDFYSEEDIDQLTENASEVTDTAIIARYHEDGEPAALMLTDGVSQMFEFKDCLEESNTLLNSVGDTIQQYRTIFENGVVVKTVWTPFMPEKSNVITDYVNYEFNRFGHWIRREYRDNVGDLIIEKRELIYY